MCGDEVPGEKEGDACGTSQTKRALRDEVRHRPLPNDANNEQAGCHDTGIDDPENHTKWYPERPSTNGKEQLTISQSLHPNIARGNFRTSMFVSLLPSTAVGQQLIAGVCLVAFVLACLGYRRLRDHPGLEHV